MATFGKVPLLVLFALATLSCRGGGQQDGLPTQAAGSTESAQQYSGVGLLPVDQSLLQEVITRTSGAQREALQDGELTLQEFEQLGLAEGQCLIDAGLGLDRSKLRLNGVAQFGYTIDLGQDFSQADRDAISNCSAEFTREVKMLWVGMTAPLVEHVAKEFRRWTTACLTENGLTADAQPWASADGEAQRITGECALAAQALFDTGNLSFGFEGDGRGP